MFSEWGQGGAFRQLAQGPWQKNKPCRKKKKSQKKEKCVLLFLKSLFPITDLGLLILRADVHIH